MADETTNSAEETARAPIARGGDPGLASASFVFTESVQRWFVRSADAIHERMKPFKGLDPARPAKNVTGIGGALVNADRALQGIQSGDYATAAYDAWVAANFAATSLGVVNDGVSVALTKNPYTRRIAGGLADVLGSSALNPTVKAACGALKPVPLAGAAINGVMGLFAAGSQALNGDYKSAGGELATTVAGVGVYAAFIVGGALLLTAGAPVVAVGAVAVGAYVASEVATEVVARAYNHFAQTNVRGSGLVAVLSEGVPRIGEVTRWVGEQYTGLADKIDESVSKGLGHLMPQSAANAIGEVAAAPIRVSAMSYKAVSAVTRVAVGMATEANNVVNRYINEAVDAGSKTLSAAGSWLAEHTPSWLKPSQNQQGTLDDQLNAHSAALKKYSKILDKDRDGKIEAHEIKQFVGADGVRDLQAAAKNGLSLSEVVKEVQEQMTENQSKQLKALIVEARQKGYTKSLDANGDGKFDMTDVNILRRTGVRLDQNSDGNISGGEFIRALKSAKASLGGRD